MTIASTATGPAVGDDRQVSDLAGDATITGTQRAVEDQASADAGPDEHDEEIVDTLAGTDPMLGQCAAVDVVADDDGAVESGTEFAGNVHRSVPAGNVRASGDHARAIEEAGAIGMEIEAVPREVGQAVDDAVSIFTFSIGAGSAACGQLLNAYDLIGSFDTFKPKFAKRYGNVNEVATAALEAYVADVASGVFPDDDHSYGMDPAEAAALAAAISQTTKEDQT